MDTDVTYHRANRRAGFFPRSVAFLSAIATIALASPSLAVDPKPDALVKNRNIEARVFLDDGGARPKADADEQH